MATTDDGHRAVGGSRHAAAVDPDRSRLECVTPFQPTQIMAAERDASTSTPTVQLGDTGSGAVRTRSRSSAAKTSSRSTVR